MTYYFAPNPDVKNPPEKIEILDEFETVELKTYGSKRFKKWMD